MQQANNVFVIHLFANLEVVGVIAGDLPNVVDVGVGISSNLLSSAGDASIIIAERVLVIVRVEVDRSVLVLDGDVVSVLDV